MYKQIVLAFVMVASLVACQEESKSVEVEREAGLLLGHEKLFTDYCLSARRKIVSDIKQRANQQSSIIFTAFFGAATEIADEVLTVERQAVEELSKQVSEPDNSISEAPLTEDQVVALIEEGKSEIRKQNLMGRLVTATKTAGMVLINAASSAIFVRLAKARTMLDAGAFMRGLHNTCNQVKEYEGMLEADLEVAREQLAAGAGEEDATKAFIQSVQVRSLNCYTPKAITRISAFCGLLKDGSAAFMKMLGLNGEKFHAIMNGQA